MRIHRPMRKDDVRLLPIEQVIERLIARIADLARPIYLTREDRHSAEDAASPDFESPRPDQFFQ